MTGEQQPTVCSSELLADVTVSCKDKGSVASSSPLAAEVAKLYEEYSQAKERWFFARPETAESRKAWAELTISREKWVAAYNARNHVAIASPPAANGELSSGGAL